MPEYTKDDELRLFARPELRQRLVQLSTMRRGWRKWTIERLPMAGYRIVTPTFMQHVINATKPTPISLIIALTRIAEGEEYELSREEAWQLSPTWFSPYDRNEDPKWQTSSKG